MEDQEKNQEEVVEEADEGQILVLRRALSGLKRNQGRTRRQYLSL